MALTDEDRELLELQRSLSAQGATVAGLPSGAAVAADPEVIRTWELRKAAQSEAYGQFVAAGDIWIGNCLTFTAGNPVPLEHVIRFDLEEREQVHRVADPDMARLGKTYETDEQFLAANPHVARTLKARAAAGNLHVSALDPRGAGAEKDEARKAGKDVTTPTTPGEDSPERRDQVAAKLAETEPADQQQDDAKPAKSTAPRRTTGKSGD